MSNEDLQRPSPEALLQLANKEESAQKRGKLTIYFGAAPGVGKTYAMLSDARLRKNEGVDVVAGYVETHGRPETDALLEGLEIISPHIIEYMGMKLKEVDLNKVIERKPKLTLIDELAHTNAPGLHNTKRYQDVEEILNAGIDVYTTMNVQHLESLNDTIHQITNIRVRETVPDTVIETAEEMKLIDLPPEELRKRLDEGKVYVKDMAGWAVHKFFRPGNLHALRQLALRVVAGSVDDKMRGYMQAHAIAGPWSAGERVLMGIFASPYADNLVRASFRLAHETDAELIALYVETDRHRELTEQEKDWLDKALDLAKKLGARVVWIKGSDVIEEILDYARKHNVTKIAIGKPRRLKMFRSLPRELVTKTPNIDLYFLDSRSDPQKPPKKRIKLSHVKKYAVSMLAVAAMTFVALLLRHHLNQTNLLFLLLLPATLSAFYWGRGPSILAALISILIFDYFFVPPYFTFTIADWEYFLTFVVCLIIVVVISNLASKLRIKIELLKTSETRSIALYGLSRDLVTAQNTEQVLTILIRHGTLIFPCEMAVFLPVHTELTVRTKTPAFEITPKIQGVASWVWHNKQAAGKGTATFPQVKVYYLPMTTQERIIGVMGFLFAEEGEEVITPETQVVLETVAHLGAMALERIK